MSDLSLRRRLASLFLVAGLVIGTLAALMAFSLARLDTAAEERVDRLGPALLQTEVLARSYSDQEAGLRGYLVAGRDDFLEAYVAGRAAERRALARLVTLLAGRPALLARVDAVRAEARAWHDSVAQPAIARTRRDGPREIPVSDVGLGKERFDRVRARLTELRAPVRAAHDDAGRLLTSYQDRLAQILVAGLLGLVVVAAITWQALRRWVVGPLQALGAEVDRVEAGDLSRQVSVDAAPKEIVELTGQVERMRVRILHEYALAEASRAEAMAAQALLEVQAQDLQRSNAELEQFAYVASHDLQEPLRKVASFCQLIERRYKGQLDERGEQYIEFAVDGAKRMQQLINDLLAFSRVGRRTGEFEQVDLEEVLAQAERQVAALLDDEGAVVTHDPLPVVTGDASLLVQLLQNLIGNGVKFRSESPPVVHLGARPGEDGFVEISCSDNGIGIEQQYEDKIFVIFQRLHGRDSYGGTGIGLAMCKKIVEFHGGRLWLDNEGTSSAGSTFRFTLPTADPRPAGPPHVPVTTATNGRTTR